MSVKVIGFEGRCSDNDVLSWGAAAFVENDKLVNAVTKLSVDRSELNDYVASGTITLLPKEIEVAEAYYESACYVVCLKANSELFKYLNIATNGLTGVIESHKYKELKIYLFSDLKDLTLYARRAIDSLVAKAISGTELPDDIDAILRAGYKLDSTNPYINALKVYSTEVESRELARELAVLNIRNETEKERFNIFLNALESEMDDYLLHYQGGVTTGGGMDINYVQKVLSSLSILHGKASSYLEETFRPVRNKFKSPRLGELEPGSAKLHFKTKIENECIAERVARYLELDLISKVISGEKIPEIIKDIKVTKAIKEIVDLDGATNLQHRLMGAEKEVNVAPLSDEIDDSVATETPIFNVLGFQSGLINDASDIEIHFSDRNIKLSAKDDGYNKEPRGVEYLQSSSGFLFKPLIFSLYLRYLDDGKHKYYLISVKEPERNKKYTIDAFPSSVMEGCLWNNANVDFVLADKAFSVDGDEIRIDGVSFEEAKDWLSDYAKWCLKRELSGVVGLELVKPTRKKLKSNSLQRLIYSLGLLGGVADQQGVVKYINENLGGDGNALVNNTRRVIRAGGSKYVILSGEKNRAFALTDAGNQYYKLVKRVVDSGAMKFSK